MFTHFLRHIGICLAIGFTVNAIPTPPGRENIRYPPSRIITKRMIYPHIYEPDSDSDNITPAFVPGGRRPDRSYDRRLSATSDGGLFDFHPWKPPFPVRDRKRSNVIREIQTRTAQPIRGKYDAPLMGPKNLALEELESPDLLKPPKTDAGCVMNIKWPFSSTFEGHYVENIGDGPLKVLEVLKTGALQDVSIKQWLALTPRNVVKAYLEFSEPSVDSFSKEKQVIVSGEQAD